MSKVYEVGIIGGGISGSVTALQLAKNEIETILFEKNESIINGPPFCHLHAGGNLYPDITDEQCRLLMKQSIEMARLFPQSIDRRPTLISIPKTEKLEPEQIHRRLKMLENFYKVLIEEDPENCVLGQADNYFKIYNIEDINNLKDKQKVEFPLTVDDWMCNAVKVIDFSKLKMPLFMVQEYGWNMFRVAAQAQLELETTEYCQLKTNTIITKIEDLRNKKLSYNWKLYSGNDVYKVKYLVNSAGYNSGKTESSLNIHSEGFIEFKAAYISKWENSPCLLPELIFHGERGTENGMAQLTPYSGNYYQIHGMTDEITLFKGGLVRDTSKDGTPLFNDKILIKLNSGWDTDEIYSRTQKAISFVSRFVPLFNVASVGGPPLFGAQQIVGSDSNLRVAEVNFPLKTYARSEIIKASSALTVAKKILEDFQIYYKDTVLKKDLSEKMQENRVSKEDITHLAEEIAVKRGFNRSMANLVIKNT